jgi:hypothetical protein
MRIYRLKWKLYDYKTEELLFTNKWKAIKAFCIKTNTVKEGLIARIDVLEEACEGAYDHVCTLASCEDGVIFLADERDPTRLRCVVR